MSNTAIILSGASASGGVGRYVADMIEHVDQGLVVYSGEGFTGGSWVRIKGLDRIPTVKALIELIRLTSRNDTSRVICHSTAGILSGIVLKLVRPKLEFIPVYHGLASRYEGLSARLVERLSCFLADTPVFLNDLDRGLLGGKGVVVPNYAPLPSSRDQNSFRQIVCVARPSPQKNLSILFSAAELLPFEKFVLFCRASISDVLTNVFRSRTPENLTVRSADDLESIYSSASVFVLPTYSEGFPLSALEAASFGVPLILSDIQVLRDIFGDSALYFANDDPQELADLIALVSNDEGVNKKYSEKSIQVAQEHSRDKWVLRWKEILRLC